MKTEYKSPKSILNKGTGFLSGYSHSLNPYTGCSFACSYCYVRQMPVSLFRKDEWGTWVDIKQNAAQLLKKELKNAKLKGKVTIFMSSSTDPYQPIEYKERITRGLLEVMVENPPDFLFIQTRSPLVTRDIDLFLKLKDKMRISMTIETDLDEIRKRFSPEAPPIQARMKALELLNKEGIQTQATIAPVLPSSEEFPVKLSSFSNRVCIDDFFMGDGSGGKRSNKLDIQSKFSSIHLDEWYNPVAYKIVYERFKQFFTDDQLYISQKGFEP